MSDERAREQRRADCRHLALQITQIRQTGGATHERLLTMVDSLCHLVLEPTSESDEAEAMRFGARDEAKLAFNHANPPEFGEESDQAARDRLETARTHALVALALAATA